MFNIEEELKKIPAKPGVYIMKDIDDNIIYVGKAVVLKNRVSSYFRKTNKTTRILKMVSIINRFEYIVTDTEAEALILECNLIKKNRPKFNVLLKDDKTYPYIKVDVKSEFPNVFTTRKLVKDGSKYFGPYPNSGAAKEMVKFIKERYKIRQCKNFKSTTRACLNYHINRCNAPCIKNITRETYMKDIEQIIMLLEGKVSTIIKELNVDLKKAVENLEFEKAAEIRDRKNAIEIISEKQKMSNINENSIDVIGMYRNELEICIEVFFIRNSKMVGREHFFFDRNDEAYQNLDEEEIVSGFFKQYYMENEELPYKIMLRQELADIEILENYLSSKVNRKVEIKVPKKGEKLKFVEMAEKNAKITLENRHKLKYDVLQELKEKLNLPKFPTQIEGFDISNISGTNIVAGMCVIKNGEINKKLSKRFKIKTVYGQDDPRCMEEVVERRLKHSLEKEKDGFGELPNLILADGGITQIRAVKRVIEKYNLNIPVFGMVKDDKHRTRALLDEERNEIKISQELLNLITLFQDEIHRTAIEYHKKLRGKDMLKSSLDDIKGIGEVKKKELLKKFGSVENIKNATIQELMEIKGITEKLAKELKK